MDDACVVTCSELREEMRQHTVDEERFIDLAIQIALLDSADRIDDDVWLYIIEERRDGSGTACDIRCCMPAEIRVVERRWQWAPARRMHRKILGLCQHVRELMPEHAARTENQNALLLHLRQRRNGMHRLRVVHALPRGCLTPHLVDGVLLDGLEQLIQAPLRAPPDQ